MDATQSAKVASGGRHIAMLGDRVVGDRALTLTCLFLRTPVNIEAVKIDSCD
jgi:hypothetical protein